MSRGSELAASIFSVEGNTRKNPVKREAECKIVVQVREKCVLGSEVAKAQR